MTLLERESQLGSLLQYADEARHRTGRLVLISGEAGVGKTSLVEEAGTWREIRRRGRAGSTGSGVPSQQTGVDVVHEAADLDPIGDQRMGPDTVDVLDQRGQLVVDDVEGLPRGVDPGGGGDPLVKLRLGGGRHRAPGVRDDEDPVDAEQVDAQHERLQRLGRHPAARVAEDLRVPVPEPQHGQRHDPGVHAGHDRDARVRHAGIAQEHTVFAGAAACAVIAAVLALVLFRGARTRALPSRPWATSTT